MGCLEGRSAFVTGAGSGIGRAIAERFHAEGANVAVLDRNGRAAFKVAAALGPRAEPYSVDVTAAPALKGALDLFAARTGRLDILVNNAGITRDGPVETMTDADWDDVLRVNLYGAFAATRAAIRHMVKHRYGRVINIASVVGMHGERNQANYAASKGGLIAFTKTVAKEIASRDITVNAIVPGLITTPLTDRMPPAVRDGVIAMVPAGRPGLPAEVAGAATFLASGDAAYVTGQVLTVDGGLY